MFRRSILTLSKIVKNCLIVFVSLIFFPIGLYLMFKNKWSNKAKYSVSVASLIIIVLTIVGIFFTPPTIELASIKENEIIRVEESTYKVRGNVLPDHSKLEINGQTVSLDKNGNFETDVELVEGENTITIKATDEDKVTEKSFKVSRISDAELAERERIRLEWEQNRLAQEATALSEAAPEPEPHDPENYWHEVLSVVDGDTIKARVDGEQVTIRIIGMDAPESINKNECFGKESSAKGKEFLNDKWIQIKSDKSQDNKDKYGRLLRYVYFDGGTDFGKRMIEEGYAYEYTYDEPYNHQNDYKSMQAYSKSKSFGLWSKKTCNGQRVKPTLSPIPISAPTPTPQPSNCDTNYSPCVPKSSYDLDCADIGFSVVVKGSDPHGFDGDGDGYGCESY